MWVVLEFNCTISGASDFLIPSSDRAKRRYAARNGTSVYAGIEVFPLLPTRLSTGLTSLLPDADHDVLVIEFSVFPDGTVTSGSVYRALIRNKAKLVYEEIGDWIESKTEVPTSVERDMLARAVEADQAFHNLKLGLDHLA